MSESKSPKWATRAPKSLHRTHHVTHKPKKEVKKTLPSEQNSFKWAARPPKSLHREHKHHKHMVHHHHHQPQQDKEVNKVEEVETILTSTTPPLLQWPTRPPVTVDTTFTLDSFDKTEEDTIVVQKIDRSSFLNVQYGEFLRQNYRKEDSRTKRFNERWTNDREKTKEVRTPWSADSTIFETDGRRRVQSLFGYLDPDDFVSEKITTTPFGTDKTYIRPMVPGIFLPSVAINASSGPQKPVRAVPPSKNDVGLRRTTPPTPRRVAGGKKVPEGKSAPSPPLAGLFKDSHRGAKLRHQVHKHIDDRKLRVMLRDLRLRVQELERIG